MSKNYTKYNVEGVGENLNKRQLVFTIVKNYVEKNNLSFEDLQKAFPDEVQGSKGFIRKESDVKDLKRFNMREPLKIKNGVFVVVSNQWGDNIKNFLEVAENIGYKISSNIQEEETTIEEPAQKVEIKGKKEAEKAKKDAEEKSKMNVYNFESVFKKLISAYSLGCSTSEFNSDKWDDKLIEVSVFEIEFIALMINCLELYELKVILDHLNKSNNTYKSTLKSYKKDVKEYSKKYNQIPESIFNIERACTFKINSQSSAIKIINKEIKKRQRI